MLISRSLLGVLGALTLATSTVLAGPTAATAAGAAVTSETATTAPTIYAVGTVVSGVELGCKILTTSYGIGYVLLGGDSAVLQPGANVTVYGQLPSGVYTTCMQGYPLQVISAWRN